MNFHDPRSLGRDGRPYGPLPRSWARYLGSYAYGDQTILAYRVGETTVMELLGAETDRANGDTVFTRTLEIAPTAQALHLRVAPESASVAVVGGDGQVSLQLREAFHVLTIPAAKQTIQVKILLAASTPAQLQAYAATSAQPQPLQPFTQGGPKRWPELLKSTVTKGADDGPFAVDTFELPERNPWNALMRLTGFDFLPDGKRMAVCTWDGDVWLVAGLDHPQGELVWQRIASGLFQPLGLKIRDGATFVCCRDQIVRLHDLNADHETDFYECFNNDHQVTEHFHEFAMGLQTDADGNFYYAKSGCHARKAVVPHHGTLLKVSRDGSRTEILATGFRAANGVCLNPDGTFFVTDQEGFWTPKNRINKVVPGGFYGNMWGYTDVTDTDDTAMQQPLCWITNKFDRSPAELIWVPPGSWGPLAGTLLNTSYGHGKLYVVPHETVAGQSQGGMCALPLPEFPTGIMRPRFHPNEGHLYVCGMFAWAGNQTDQGGFYRVRTTGKKIDLPLGLQATERRLTLTFTEPLAAAAATNPQHFTLTTWDLKRSKDYGSKHYNERQITVSAITLSPDRKTVHLEVPDLQPTRGMEISYQLQGDDGRAITGVIHNTIHTLGAP
jgi:hypothetical protein